MTKRASIIKIMVTMMVVMILMMVVMMLMMVKLISHASTITCPTPTLKHKIIFNHDINTYEFISN